MKNQYKSLIGITKKDLIEKLGDGFNFYPDTIWTYLLHKNFFGRKTFLVITFKDEMVIDVNIIKKYGDYKAKL
ncbi:hypothetical protein [Chryseobacterium sp. OSA05B]|uniref:hypothetical protein n=1 Tax=Chryseobacterium sp. OSA05B TaxID=2862650 RepID=UPI001CBFF882|nr:hypothetical protein [Chryseobacterium sp. OSA05B]